MSEEYHCKGCNCKEDEKINDEYVQKLLYKIDQDIEELQEFQRTCNRLLKKLTKSPIEM